MLAALYILSLSQIGSSPYCGSPFFDLNKKGIQKEGTMAKTETNLRKAFAGESQAYQKYLAYARRAADESMDGVYKLFHAAAASEKIHAQRHASYLKSIKTTSENLKEAMAGEMHEFKIMYPGMIADAKAERKAGPEISFSHANEVEKVHHDLFKSALKNPDKFPVRDYYLCYACGYIVTGKPKARCPICGAVKKSFHKVE
jgi:rubrerythrin